MNGLGVEVAKNVVLAGVKSVTLHDDKPTELGDLGAQFFLRESDVGQPRAAVTRQAGADYRLVGRISTLDSRDNTTGMTQRFTQIVFDMIDLETGLSIWTNLYSFTKATADSVVYR